MEDVVRALAFGVSIASTALVVRLYCGDFPEMGRSDVPLQPPDWVFGVVWPCLYVTTGAAWVLGKQDPLLVALTSLCCSWLVVYLCLRKKKAAAGILAASALLAAWTVVATADGTAAGTAGAAALSPLALWLGFATYLNLYDAFVNAAPPSDHLEPREGAK